MELLDGGRLAEAQAAKPLPARTAAGLIETLARTIDYAHRQGVVHRDLNPANVLLAPGRERPAADHSALAGRLWLDEAVPKISDFGLAKYLDQDSRLTKTGFVMGTPSYMAPEQVRGQNDQVGPAADTYALGAVLYELLTGRPPFLGATALESMNQVAEMDPVPPARLIPQVPRDLEIICLKCLEKEPAKRYASAVALADDLRRFLAGEPIRARQVGTLERAWRWARRRPAVAGLLLAVVAALLAGTGVSSYFALESSRRADEAERATEAKQKALEAAQKARLQSDVRAAELQLRAGLAHCEAGAIDVGLFNLLDAWRLAPENAGDFRRVVRTNLAGWSRQLPVLRHVLTLAQGGQVLARFLGADGQTLVAWTANGSRVQRWNTTTGEALGPPFVLPDGEVVIDVSPDGTLLSTQKQGQGLIRDLATGQLVSSWLQHRQANNEAVPTFAFFGASGQVVMTRSDDFRERWGFRRFWQLAPPAELPATVQFQAGDGCHLTTGRDGKTVLVVFRQAPGERPGSPAPHAEFWDLAAGKRLAGLSAPVGGPDPRFRWNGEAVLSVSGDRYEGFEPDVEGSVSWWDTAAGRRLGEVWRPRRQSLCSVLTQDGQSLAAFCEDQRVRLYELATGRQRGGDIPAAGFKGHEWAGRVAASPDGSVVLTAAANGTVRLWQTRHFLPQTTAAANFRPRPPPGGPEIVTSVFSADGKTVLACPAAPNHQGRLLATSSDRPLVRPLRQQHLHSLAFSPNGALIATAPDNHEFGGKAVVYLWDAATGRLRASLNQYRYIHTLAFSQDSRTLAVGCVGGTFLWDVVAARPRHFLRERSTVGHLVFSPDGSRLAVAYKRGWAGVGAGLRLWDVTTGQPVGEFLAADHPQRPQPYFVPAFADGGRTLRAFDTFVGVLHALDARTGAARGQPLTLERVDQAVFSADGASLATSQSDGSVQQWNPAAGQRVGPPLAQPHPVVRFVFSPDRRTLAVACRDQAVRLWDAATSLPVGPPLPHRAPVLDLTFTPDCASLATLTATGAAHTWPLPRLVADDPDRMELWLQATAGVRLEGAQVHALDIKTWQRCRQRLHERWPDADPALRWPTDHAAWHDARAREAEEDGNTFAGVWHLERLLALRPGDWQTHARLGWLFAEAGDLDRAEAAYGRAAGCGDGEGLLTWYRHVAASLLARGKWAAALRYLDWLAIAGVDDWQLHADRAEVLGKLGKPAEQDAALARGVERDTDGALLVALAEKLATEGQWVRAAALFARAAAHGHLDLEEECHYGLACLKAGDGGAYRRVCNRLLQDLQAGGPTADARLAASFGSLHDLVRLCVLRHDAVGDWRPLGQLAGHVLAALETTEAPADRSLQEELRRAWLGARGAVLCRAGRYREAIDHLQKSVGADGTGGTFTTRVFLALAHQGLGQAAEARRWIDKAFATPPAPGRLFSWEALEVALLRPEADALRGPAEKR
jgi:WD40 repeat protein/tetratricopeptide (TPR) repeat protein